MGYFTNRQNCLAAGYAAENVGKENAIILPYMHILKTACFHMVTILFVFGQKQYDSAIVVRGFSRPRRPERVRCDQG